MLSVAHLAADRFTGLPGLRHPLLGDLTGHAEVLLENGELLLGVLLELRVLFVLRHVHGHEDVLFVAADLVEDECAVELRSLFLLKFLELGLMDLVHLLRALLSDRLLVLAARLLVLAAGLLVLAAGLLPGLLGQLLELLLGSLVVLCQSLGELLDLLVLAALFDELAGLNFKLVVARGFADAFLDVFGTHFFPLILLVLLPGRALLGAGLAADRVLLLLCLAVTETRGGSDCECRNQDSFHGKTSGSVGDGGEKCDDDSGATTEDVRVWGLASCFEE